MYLLGSSIVLVLAFISSVTEARPDLVDSVIGAISDVVYDDCQEISDPNVCAIGKQKKMLDLFLNFLADFNPLSISMPFISHSFYT